MTADEIVMRMLAVVEVHLLLQALATHDPVVIERALAAR